MEINEILEISPYSLSKDQKRELLNNRLHELTRKHYEQCLPYRRMMDAMELDMDNLPGYEKLPFLPVRLFKEFELRSCEKDEIVKTMTSSGTTGQQVSRIFLDRETSSAQQKCLTKIVSHFIGTKRVQACIYKNQHVGNQSDQVGASVVFSCHSVLKFLQQQHQVHLIQILLHRLLPIYSHGNI